ncbi:SpoIIIAH-like family protein [Phosphitispora fastidiosa]|uniref:SpoIIIAH-like family protein n=1 Tax=Phosphitispora fastidiosa TaxID=2837202 RepID=UPI001E4A0306|nr:SpoIIIAH-like family protein [Phosphitispora fastidiosa]
MLFIKKKGLWTALLILGVFFIAAGLFQLSGIPTSGDTGTMDTGTADAGIADIDTGDIRNPGAVTGDAPESAAGSNCAEGAENGAFFVEYRLERDRTRSQQIDLLREIVNNSNSSDDIRNEAQTRLLAISQAIDTEMKLENLIRAEDFKDAVVFVEEKSVTIIIQSPVLTQPDREKLTAITARVTGINADNIAVFAKL